MRTIDDVATIQYEIKWHNLSRVRGFAEKRFVCDEGKTKTTVTMAKGGVLYTSNNVALISSDKLPTRRDRKSNAIGFPTSDVILD